MKSLYSNQFLKRTCRLLAMTGMFLLASHTVIAQSSPILERRITVQFDQLVLSEALKVIEQKANCSFSYKSKIIDSQKRVTVNAVNRPVREVVLQVCGPAVQVGEKGHFLILTEVPAKSKSGNVLKGYIEDNTGRGVGNATVYDPATLYSANTNEFGYYELKIDPLSPPSELEIRRQDYRDTAVTLHQSANLVDAVQMDHDTTFHRKWLDRKDSARVWVSEFSTSLFERRPERWNVQDTIYRNVQVSFLPYLGTNRRLSGSVINRTSFNIIGGVSRGVSAFELGGVFNIVREDVDGVQIAGALNLVGQDMRGVQVAGLSNINLRRSEGVMAAGALNLLRAGGEGVSVAGLSSVSIGEFEGVSINGFAHISAGRAEGVQVSGFSNLVTGSMSGVQIAGFSNVALRNSDGVQVAGALNIVGGDFKGVQVSGLLNFARRVDGIQIGVFNYCDTISGVPVGFLSFVAKGYHPLELSTNDLNMIDLSWRTGVRSFYTFLSAGVRTQPVQEKYPWQYGYGIGTSPRLSERLWLNVELSSHHLSPGKFAEQLSLDNRFAVLADLRITKHLSIFGGPVVHGYFDHTNRNDLRELVGVPDRLITEDSWSTLRLSGWVGWKAGIRLF
jgi:hypothetical protein